jgi:hypothetical protein
MLVTCLKQLHLGAQLFEFHAPAQRRRNRRHATP